MSILEQGIFYSGTIAVGFDAAYIITNKNLEVKVGTVSISTNSFKGALMETISLPDSLLAIGSYAFENCEELQNIEIPDTAIIQHTAFIQCNKLTSVSWRESSASSTKITILPDSIFHHCDLLASLEMPNSLVTIEGDVASWCSLQTVTIPNGVTSVGINAFAENHALTAVVLSDVLTNLKQSAFGFCYLLSNVSFHNVTEPQLTYFNGTDVFTNCPLQSFVPFERLTSINGGSFDMAEFTSVIINPNITQINPGAFNRCDELVTAYMTYEPSGSNILYRYIFDETYTDDAKTTILTQFISGTTNNWVPVVMENGIVYSLDLTTVLGFEGSRIPENGNITILNTVTTIETDVLQNCEFLKNIILPPSITIIKNNAFSTCVNLETVTFSDIETSLLETVGSSAFSLCTSLFSIVLPNSITVLGESLMLNCTSLTAINIPDLVSNIPTNFVNGCSSLTTVNLSENNEILINNSGGGGSFTNCSLLTAFPFENTIALQTLPDFTNSGLFGLIRFPKFISAVVSENVLNGCSNLTGIEMKFQGENNLWSRFEYDVFSPPENKTDALIRYLNSDHTGWFLVYENGDLYPTDFVPSTKEELKTALNNWLLPDGDPNKDSSTYFYVSISDWDTSLITDMSDLFTNESTFNDDISNWDVSSVTDMTRMFEGATSFNNNISNWDVSSVTNTDAMFNEASSFNGNISTWNVSSVTDMVRMFEGATSFNNDIGNWDVSSVLNMSNMFNNTMSFNQDLSTWNVSFVTNMTGMFEGATSFNENISNWNVSSVTDMVRMFEGATSFNNDIGNWDVSSVLNMSNMFNNTMSFNQDLSTWNVSSVTNMTGMFENASSFNENISNWNVSSITDMVGMFEGATSFNNNISNWNVSSVLNMSNMFNNAMSFNQDLSTWDVSSVSNMNELFKNATSFNQDLSTWDVSSVSNMNELFKNTTSFNQDLSTWDISSVSNMSNMLSDSALSSINYGNTLKGWYELSNTPPNITLGASNLTYTYSTQTYKTSLTSDNNWTIHDSGLTTTEYGIIYDNNTLVATSFDFTTLPSSGAINFRSNTVSISSSAFLSQTSIKSVLIPSSMTSISNNAFKGCSGITNITFFDNSTCVIISDSAFEDCDSLLNITIPSSVTTINNLSFNNCSGMQYAIMTSLGIPYTYIYTTETDKTTAMQNFLTDPSSWTQSTVTTSTVVSSSDSQITIVESPIPLTNETRNSFANNLFIENSSLFSSSVNSFVTDNTVLNIENTIPSVSTVRVFNSISNNETNSFVVNEITTVPDIGTYVIMDVGSTVKINIINSIDNSSHYINVNKNSSTESTIYIDGSSTGSTYNTGDSVIIFNNSITIGSISQVQKPQGTFQYTQPTTDYDDSDSPFVNTDGSFTTLTKSTSVSGNNTIVSWAYIFNDTENSLVDGLYLNETITTPGNMTIDDFDSIPMSRQGSQFNSYSGSFPSTSTNMPALLSNTSYVEMFYGASNFNQDISDWDKSTVSDMSYMFYNAHTFDQNLGNWNISNVTSMNNMLDNSGLSVDNYNLTLNGWASQTVQQNITLGADRLKYSSDGETGRKILINDYKWDIEGDRKNNSIMRIPNIVVPPKPEILIKLKFISSTIFNEYSTL